MIEKIVSNLIFEFSAKNGSSFLLGIVSFFSFIIRFVFNFFNKIISALMGIFWLIVKFVFGVIDLFEYITERFLGIDQSLKDYQNFLDVVSPEIVNKLVGVFRAIVGVSIVLMIIFTIYGMIKQEYKNASSGFIDSKKDKTNSSSVNNSKVGFFKALLKNTVMIIALPLTLILAFTGVNAILSSFYRVLNIGKTTVSGQVLATASYSSNRFRIYANANQRVPIIIKAYNDDAILPGDEAKAAFQISGIEVQNKLRNTATNLSNSSFLSFEQSVVYKNNKFYNSDRFGDYYESFICTAEQYYVMADFVDYAQRTGINYYIKATSDKQVDWSYVTSAVYNNIDHSLKIEYVDANHIYTSGETYEMTYVPGNNVTSPISDALKTISALLGIGEYGDNLYNEMERDEDSLNIVYWAREKALLKFSSGVKTTGEGTSRKVDLSDQKGWTDTDQIIFYELNHFKYNNTLAGHTLEDFIDGVEIDVQQLVYRDYVSTVNMYTEDRTIDFITLNGNRYLVEKSETESDKDGHLYYKLVSYEGSNFLVSPNEYKVEVEKNSNQKIKLSPDFNLNNPASWKIGDQILVYEYYSNPKYTNNLLEYSFDNFVSGVSLPTYNISSKSSTGTYFLLGGRYYTTSIFSSTSVLENFISESSTQTTYYNYKLILNNLSVNWNNFVLGESLFVGGSLKNSDSEQYKDLDKKLMFSKNFKFNNVSTWSYKDAFIMWMYCNKKLGSTTLDLITNIGIQGSLYQYNSNDYYYKVAGTDNYINAAEVLKLSDLNIYNEIDKESTYLNTNFAVLDNVFEINFDSENDKITKEKGSSYKFTFSSNFNSDDEDISNWTLGDLVLYLLSENGTIDNISYVKSRGYNAVSFEAGKYLFGNYLSNNYYELNFGENDVSSVWNANVKTYLGQTIVDSTDKLGELVEVGLITIKEEPVNLIDPTTSSSVKFSSGFDASDFSTWTVTDFLIYNYINNNEQFQKSIYDGGIGAVKFTVLKKYSAENDDWKGNTIAYSVVQLGTVGSGNYCYEYETFKELGNQIMPSFEFKNNPTNTISCKLTDTVEEASSITTIANTTTICFTYKHESADEQSDFVYENKYYYSGLSTVFDASLSHADYFAASELINSYFSTKEASGATSQIDLTLSPDFNPAVPSSWTLLETIIVYEFMLNNGIYGVKELEEFKTIDYFVDYVKTTMKNPSDASASKDYYVALIGTNFYKFIDLSELNKTLTEINASYGNLVSIASDKIISDESVLYKNINFAVTDYSLKEPFDQNNSEKIIKYIPQDNNIFSYSSGESTTTYRKVDNNTKQNYHFSASEHVVDSYGPLVRQVSWPEKLMEDMLIMYPDLNWNTLLATDSWVDTLGDYVSAYANGSFISEGNSSNTTAAGLVLSEFLLSHVEKVSYTFAGHEYSSIFDEETINALMLSLMGEQNYYELVKQADIFVEMFNNTFAPVIEEVAKSDGIKVLEGKVENFELCVYKAFLATLVLSSDFGEYLYTVATRVYAQYTIYESLARAAGDYSSYYAYTNGYTDVNGDTIDVFKYGSFEDLVTLENKTCGNSTPMFTFNIKNAASALGITLGSDDKVNFVNVRNELFKKYKSNYFGMRQQIPDTDPCYCFLYDVYFSICESIGISYEDSEHPSYLGLFRDYLKGDIKRWSVLNDLSIDGASQYFPKYDNIKSSLTTTKLMAAVSLLLFKNEMTVNLENVNKDNTFWENLGEMSVSSIYSMTESVFSKSDTLTEMFDDVFGYHFNFLNRNVKYFFDVFEKSENGNKNSWKQLQQLSANLTTLTSAFSLAIEANGNAVVYSDQEKGIKEQQVQLIYEVGEGSEKKTYSKQQYEQALAKMNSYKTYIDMYVAAQTALDKAAKASISFTLAQYGDSFKTNGYIFSVNNRPYMLTATSSATRLAEYVYGGSYLVKNNIEPIYTDRDFSGIISQTRTYSDNDVKISLGMWTKLRTFASRLAQYTARLYYQTNYVDMAETIQNGVYLTDNINGTTPELLIINWLITGSESLIDINTLARLIYAEDDLANFITGNSSNLSSALSGYVNGIYSGTRSSSYYTQTNKELRIHEMFKNVVTYLTVSEEQGKTISEDSIVLSPTTTIEEFKAQLMQKVIKYEKNENETAEENINRYLTLFYMLNMRFDYSANGENLGTTLRPVDIKKDANGNRISPLTYKPNDKKISVSFSIDKSSQNTVISLAGLENRPIEELVGLEYDSLYDRNGVYDEAWGDIFVVCAYDESKAKYYPILMRPEEDDVYSALPEGNATNKTNKYLYGEYCNFFDALYGDSKKTPTPTSPYYQGIYPIVARGIITNSGTPTAIKIQDGHVIYYRTNITASASLSPEAIYATSSVSEISTIGYTKYVESTSYKKVSGSTKQVMFVGSADIGTYLNSSSTVYFLQDKIEYNLSPSDDYDAISVLDQFQAYYNLGGATSFLLWLGILSIFPLMFRACAAVLRRILDIIFLTLTGPVVISLSTISEKNKAGFDKWKNMVTSTMIAAFGYIVGFNIYYLLTKSLLTMNFVSDLTLSRIALIGGFSFVKKSIINSILKYLFLIVATSLIHKSAIMFTTILSNNQITDPFASALDGKDIVQGIKEVIDSVRDSGKKLKSIYSGEALVGLANAAVQVGKNFVPGAQIVASTMKSGKKIKNKIAGKATEKMLASTGIPPSVAKEAGKQMTKQLNEQMEAKEKMQVEKANKFMSQFVDDKNKSKFFGETKSLGESVTKNINKLPSFRKSFKEAAGIKTSKDKKDKKEKKPQKPKKKKK